MTARVLEAAARFLMKRHAIATLEISKQKTLHPCAHSGRRSYNRPTDAGRNHFLKNRLGKFRSTRETGGEEVPRQSLNRRGNLFDVGAVSGQATQRPDIPSDAGDLGVGLLRPMQTEEGKLSV
ncbi:hypothetical protein EVAR_95006_1 [Eumeta japonica]|uniref:Uncharacterized protein n=1 Tax=Eumeta variegata TaxID=151549 RepID=A0A4C1VVY2_EUMVA|nr:hypothetical protein EVAR_95006_1 [Eumeta japonica]